MKLGIFVLLLTLLSSCFLSKKKHLDEITHNPPVIESPIKDTNFSRYQISENKLDTSEMQLSYEYYRKPVFPWQDSINKYTAKFIFDNCYFELPTNVEIVCDDKAFVACLDTFYAYAQKDYLENKMRSLWDLSVRTSIHDEYKQFILLYYGVSSYSGGAHPNSYFNHIMVDKTTNKRLLLKDFISDTLEFNKIAEACFRKDNEISENENLSDLGFWFENGTFNCGNNFYLTEDSFNFFFNTYEVAPYTFGLLEFSVPFTLSKHLIKIDLSKK